MMYKQIQPQPIVGHSSWLGFEEFSRLKGAMLQFLSPSRQALALCCSYAVARCWVLHTTLTMQ